MADFDLYRLSDDHEALRDAVRSLCAAKVAPHAAEVDEQSAFPQVAYDALAVADFHAPTSRRPTAAPVPTPSRPAW